jgi:hypothetical protein
MCLFLLLRSFFKRVGGSTIFQQKGGGGGLNYDPSPTMGTFSSTAIEIIYRLKICSTKVKVFPHLEALKGQLKLVNCFER